MAVQAQYPSNILLLNPNRNGQEGKKNMIEGGDYALQSQPEEVLHHSQMFYGNGVGVNPRKRVREAMNTTADTPVNLFHLQSQPSASTLIDLAQLHNHHSPMVSTGLRLSLEDQQQQQQQQRGLLLPSILSSSSSSFLLEDLSLQINQQKDEIDHFLQSQGEQLRRMSAESHHRQHRVLLAAAEESVSRRLREKEAEVEKAARRNAELEERAAHLKAEAHVWQARARAQEASAASLQAQLREAMMSCGGAHDKREEVGCAGDGLPVDDAESAHIDPGRVVSVVPPCLVCRKRSVSVVLIPCRHLCVCSGCDTVIGSCPVCHSVRSTSVEVYLS
ncbi:zinc finger protein [Cinnamomum micranthum f. kanehirae]|uniref:Zinc finger protein n=1 Tax=Cinnamomum micranthum f. kanehirae TaxID=337451 RepID=A0A443PG27_9MAGN|nr:zinc finger protein [Cinnamomum micranthum f. kanehirae]